MRLFFVCALSFFQMSCALFNNDSKERANLHQQMGNSFFQAGRYPEALRELLQAEKLDSSNPMIQNNIGLIYFARSRPDLAEKYIKRAIDLEPKYTDAKNNLARIYIEVGKYQEADALLKVVLQDLTYSDSTRAWINLGLSKFAQKDWSKSQESFQKAVRLNRDNCSANTYLGRTYLELEFLSQAADTLDSAVGYCQKDFNDEAHYFSALAWYRLGDKKRALSRFEEITKIYPDGKYRARARAMIDVVKKELE
jgi:type IV pilus assembly protein PilF